MGLEIHKNLLLLPVFVFRSIQLYSMCVVTNYYIPFRTHAKGLIIEACDKPELLIFKIKALCVKKQLLLTAYWH
jgi:hypothetical protein